MPRKTLKKGGLFGLFTTYKPDPSRPIIKSSEREILIALSTPQGKYELNELIISKDNGKSWSKIDYRKLTPSENKQYKDAQIRQFDASNQNYWNNLPQEQKEREFQSNLAFHEIWRKKSGKQPLTPEQIEQSRQRFFQTGIPNTIHAGSKKTRKMRKTKRRV